MMKPTVLLSLLLPAVFAQVSNNNSALFGYAVGGVYPVLHAPYSFSADGQTANVTGHSLLAGYNITYANYSLSINITEVWVGGATDRGPSSDVFTNTYIDLTPPSSVGYGSNATVAGWNTCIVVLTNLTMNATKAGQNDTGYCYETFGHDCAQNLTLAFEKAWENITLRNSTACEALVIPNVPSQCAGQFTLASEFAVAPPSTFQLDIDTATESYFPLLYVGTQQHPSSNTSYYEDATSRIWPILFMQSPRSIFGSGNFSSYGSGTSLSCLKATNATQGSKALTGPTSVGIRMTPGLFVLGVIGFAVAFAGLI